MKYIVFIIILFCNDVIWAQEKNLVIDYSHAGYGGGGVNFPIVPSILYLTPTGGDDTPQIRLAIDCISKLPVDENGFRGALCFSSDKFRIDGDINISDDGIVLRGTKTGKKITKLIASGSRRRSLLCIGRDNPCEKDTVHILLHTPSGSRLICVEKYGAFKAGERIVVVNRIGENKIIWDRCILKVTDKGLLLDAPITADITSGYVAKTEPPLRHFGLENLVIQSQYDTEHLMNEEHAWFAVETTYAEDLYFDNIETQYFVSSSMHIGQRTRRVTIRGCEHKNPVSEITGYRRLSYWISGQQVLVYSCLSERGVCDFASGEYAGGPNVFLSSLAAEANGASGGYEELSCGILYEDVHVQYGGITLDVKNGKQTAVNSILCNCSADFLHTGESNMEMNTEKSLYRSLLKKRKGKKALLALDYKAPIIDYGQPFDGQANADEKETNYTSIPFKVDTTCSIKNDYVMTFIPGKEISIGSYIQKLADAGYTYYQIVPEAYYALPTDTNSYMGTLLPPYHEQISARIGENEAMDGMSRYDVTYLNPYFFDRLEKCVTECNKKGITVALYLYNINADTWKYSLWNGLNNMNPTPMDITTLWQNRDIHKCYIYTVLDRVKDMNLIIKGMPKVDSVFESMFNNIVAEWEEEYSKKVLKE